MVDGPAMLEMMEAEWSRPGSRSRPGSTSDGCSARNEQVVGTSVDLVCHGTYVLRRALWQRKIHPPTLEQFEIERATLPSRKGPVLNVRTGPHLCADHQPW
jgi:hypothetical protein